MRLLSIVLVLACIAGGLAPMSASFAADEQLAFAPSAAAQQDADDGDDRVVEVQLAVLAAAVILVVVIGVAGYVVRKRLGLVAPPPDQSEAGHH